LLYVNETPLDDAALRAISQIRSLEDLTLYGAYCSFTDEGLRDIGSLKRLRFLRFNLGNGINEFTDEGVAQLSSLDQLETLSVRGGKISDRGLGELTKLSRLKELRISAGSLTPTGIRDFEQHSTATLVPEKYFNFHTEFGKIVEYVNRRAPDSQAPTNKLGLKADQMPTLYETLMVLYFERNKPQGEEFIAQASALDDPSLDEFIALLVKMIGK
jgi:hypothetical protein